MDNQVGSVHIQRGIRTLLELPWAYRLFRNLIQSEKGRRQFVLEFVRPFAGARILDIGCGTGGLLSYLPSNIEYLGYDLNPSYINSAKQRYGARGQFFCADINDQGAPQIEDEAFDIILAIGLLHHLNDIQAQRLCESAYRQLKKGGVFFTFDGVYVPEQSKVARYIISRDRGRAVRTAEGYKAVVQPIFDRFDYQIKTDLLRIPYTHFLMHCYKDL